MKSFLNYLIVFSILFLVQVFTSTFLKAHLGGRTHTQKNNHPLKRKPTKKGWSDLCRLFNFSLYICKTWIIQNKFRIICRAYSRCLHKLSSPSFFLISHPFGSYTLIGFTYTEKSNDGLLNGLILLHLVFIKLTDRFAVHVKKVTPKRKFSLFI